MKFTKMHGYGNDFIVVNAFNTNIDLSVEQAAFLCDRHFGIGADGVLLLLPSSKADIRMRIFNSDGSEAEMCGNGIRCISKFAFDNGIVKNKNFSVETKTDIKNIVLLDDEYIKVNMGKGEMLPNPTTEYDLSCVSVGNPHAIMIIEEDLQTFPVADLGPKIENHKGFPKKTNVEFVKIIDRNNIEMRVWERGCGQTLCCGTGVTATAFALHKKGLVDENVNIKMTGGVLKVELVGDEIFLIGNATKVYDGEIII
ncbi:MAG: diaminopimelate epimerase [Rickettsiales bacterium]|nr:MAG: diaminopimelate epimerase [Rickettsiales bacterium]